MKNRALNVAVVTNVVPSYREGFYDRLFSRDDVSRMFEPAVRLHRCGGPASYLNARHISERKESHDDGVSMKLLFLSNVPSPYMVDFFNELGKFTRLTVVFEKHTSSDRDPSWEEYRFRTFDGIVLRGISTAADTAFCPQVIRYIGRRCYDHIIVTNPSTPTGVMAIEYMKWTKTPFILESEGGFAKDGKGLKEKFKRHLMSGARLYFSTTEVDDEYFLMYGATKDRIVRYPFTSLYEQDLLKEPISQEEKAALKRELGIETRILILSVGRFVRGKGFDILLNACKRIDPAIGVCIVGGVPSLECATTKTEHKLANVHFAGFKSKVELRKYYKASDLFVLPTREDTWGLVINEAMACGLPVVTTNRCVAGLALVREGENGFIVRVGDERALAEKMQVIAGDDELRRKMSRRSIDLIQWYTFENMAKRHIEILEGVAR